MPLDVSLAAGADWQASAAQPAPAVTSIAPSCHRQYRSGCTAVAGCRRHPLSSSGLGARSHPCWYVSQRCVPVVMLCRRRPHQWQAANTGQWGVCQHAGMSARCPLAGALPSLAVFWPGKSGQLLARPHESTGHMYDLASSCLVCARRLSPGTLVTCVISGCRYSWSVMMYVCVSRTGGTECTASQEGSSRP